MELKTAAGVFSSAAVLWRLKRKEKVRVVIDHPDKSYWERGILEDTLSHHSIGNALEACDVGTGHQIVTQTVLLSGVNAHLIDGVHDLVQLLVDLFFGPDQTLAVLGHFQSGGSNAAGVNSLGGSNDNAFLSHQIGQSVIGGGHVGNFDVVLHTSLDDLLSVLHVNVVLHCRRHNNIDLDAPRLFLGEELNAELLSVVLNAVTAAVAHLDQIGNLLLGGVLCTLVANTIVVKSASYVNSATTTILASMEIVVGAIVGLLLFGEMLTFLQIVGAVIIVVASLGMELAEKPAAGVAEQDKH